ncbi:hypothetical protein P4670_17210 [Neobacillus cucumis]|nr:hypothetical protein [Neobacillus cucumis]
MSFRSFDTAAALSFARRSFLRFFPNDSTYCFIVDTYFDDALLFETYFRYISSYESFNDYKKHLDTHVDQYFEYLAGNVMTKWNTALENERETRKK